MTALAALIDSVENPTRILWNGMEVFSTEEDAFGCLCFELGWWLDDVYTEYSDYMLDRFRDRIATNVQAGQLAAGIKVETVGESLGLS